MSKNEFVWVFNASALMGGLDSPLSLEYHLPEQKLFVRPEQLTDERMWLVAKQDEHAYLFGFLAIELVERYEGGIYNGDYLLRANPFGSVRLLPRLESGERWRLPVLDFGEEGIREVYVTDSDAFTKLIKDNEVVSFAQPEKVALNRIQKTGFSDLEQAASDQLQLALRTLAFGDAVRSQAFPKPLSAFGGVALSILEQVLPQLDTDKAKSLIASLDPLVGVQISLRPLEDVLEASGSLPPSVDTFLEDIDPDSIAPRSFVARSAVSAFDWLDKTTQAEEAHERILKDVVLYMKGKGYSVKKSRSFDLFAEKGGERLLIEVKSTTSQNLVAQGEKGIIQLLRYSAALSTERSTNLRFVVLLQDQPQASVLEYLANMATRVGFELCLYRQSKDWPQRLTTFDYKNFRV
ncbi:hypothetical protein BH11PAT2_BH11PAT2_09150 [soil metagenome]